MNSKFSDHFTEGLLLLAILDKEKRNQNQHNTTDVEQDNAKIILY